MIIWSLKTSSNWSVQMVFFDIGKFAPTFVVQIWKTDSCDTLRCLLFKKKLFYPLPSVSYRNTGLTAGGL